jgi:hypothetical protein
MDIEAVFDDVSSLKIEFFDFLNECSTISGISGIIIQNNPKIPHSFYVLFPMLSRTMYCCLFFTEGFDQSQRRGVLSE